MLYHYAPLLLYVVCRIYVTLLSISQLTPSSRAAQNGAIKSATKFRTELPGSAYTPYFLISHNFPHFIITHTHSSSRKILSQLFRYGAVKQYQRQFCFSEHRQQPANARYQFGSFAISISIV